MLETHRPINLAALKRKAIERAIWLPENPSDDLIRARNSRTQFRFLLEEMTTAAVTVARDRKVDDDEFDCDQLFSEATHIVVQIRNAFVDNPYEGDIKASWNFWKHIRDPFQVIQKKEIPYMDRSSLESAAAEYLDSPFRCTPIDRLLIDSLIAAEIFAFGHEMWNPSYSVAPMKQKHAVWSYLSGQFWNAVILGGIIAFAGWLYSKEIIGGTVFGWIAGILFGLILLSFALATIFLPNVWWKQSKMKRKISALMDEMIGVYSELQSDGVISAEHIRTRSQKAADSGVKWPATLFAVLDDIVRRTGRF